MAMVLWRCVFRGRQISSNPPIQPGSSTPDCGASKSGACSRTEKLDQPPDLKSRTVTRTQNGQPWGAWRLRDELVIMPHTFERACYHDVLKTERPVESSDADGKPLLDSEMTGFPGHLISHPNQAACHAGNCSLMRAFGGLLMGINAPRQIKHPLRRPAIEVQSCTMGIGVGVNSSPGSDIPGPRRPAPNGSGNPRPSEAPLLSIIAAVCGLHQSNMSEASRLVLVCQPHLADRQVAGPSKGEGPAWWEYHWLSCGFRPPIVAWPGLTGAGCSYKRSWLAWFARMKAGVTKAIPTTTSTAALRIIGCLRIRGDAFDDKLIGPSPFPDGLPSARVGWLVSRSVWVTSF